MALNAPFTKKRFRNEYLLSKLVHCNVLDAI
jgi:hypothetical protein